MRVLGGFGMLREYTFFNKDLSVILIDKTDSFDYPENYFMSHFGYDNNTYKLFFADSPECKIFSGKYIGTHSSPFLAVAQPFQRMEFYPDLSRDFNLLYIRIHPTVFEKNKCDDTFLRVFDNMTDEASIFELSGGDSDRLFPIISLIKDSILHKYGRYSVESACTSLITGLTVIYDENHPQSDVDSTNISVKLINYINKHYTGKLTYDVLCKKFFISVPSINKIVKNYTGLTFGNYVNSLRLEDAKKMMNENCISVHKAAELSGFSSYNAFYRAYTKYFGHSPSEDKSPQPVYYPFDEDK